MNILGVNYGHDSSAAIVIDGKLVSAIEQERLDRRKHSPGFPTDAIKFVLKSSGLKKEDLNHVIYSWHPTIYLSRRFILSFKNLPNIKTTLRTLKSHFYEETIAPYIRRTLFDGFSPHTKISFIEHHMSHASSAFFVSGFDEAAILTMDGRGEWSTSLLAIGRGNEIIPIKRTFFPNSVGYFYTMITYYLGFIGYGNEYKVMGLAPYGRPVYIDEMRRILKFSSNDLFNFNADYFAHPFLGASPHERFSKKLVDMLGAAKDTEEKITQRHMDIARSAQYVLNEVAVKIAELIKKETNMENLCLAGGVALNAVMNNEIRKTSFFKNIFIQPASNDSGTAIGNAFYGWNVLENGKRLFKLEHAYWGPEFQDADIEKEIKLCRLSYRKIDNPAETGAYLLFKDKIIGWFQGRSEIGPRALGNRSILANPCKKENKDIVNARIKFREEFRPFAPAVIEEMASEYFDLEGTSPYMLMICQVKHGKEKEIPAVTHEDHSARVQTVSKKTNPLFWNLICKFGSHSGTPVVLNTSFNVKGEPMVDSPTDAIRCFFSTGLDYLIIGSYLVFKDCYDEDINLPGVIR